MGTTTGWRARQHPQRETHVPACTAHMGCPPPLPSGEGTALCPRTAHGGSFQLFHYRTRSLPDGSIPISSNMSLLQSESNIFLPSDDWTFPICFDSLCEFIMNSQKTNLFQATAPPGTSAYTQIVPIKNKVFLNINLTALNHKTLKTQLYSRHKTC